MPLQQLGLGHVGVRQDDAAADDALGFDEATRVLPGDTDADVRRRAVRAASRSRSRCSSRPGV